MTSDDERVATDEHREERSGEETDPFSAIRRDGVLQVRHPGATWLSSGANGGQFRTDCAYNVSVPEGWNRTDLGAYVSERLERAGFSAASDAGRNDGQDADLGLEVPALLTGVEMGDVRGARCGPVTAYATAGVSNPAALPMEPAGGTLSQRHEHGATSTPIADTDSSADEQADPENPPGWGTVNVIVGTTRSLADGALANLLAVAVEAKAATLLETTGVPGTTTDAIVAGYDPAGEPVQFTGSGTVVGTAARACVREAVRASLEAHYAGRDSSPQEAAADAPYDVSTDVEATVFEVAGAE